MAKISDRSTRVQNMLGGRTETGFISRVYNWLMDAYLEIGMGYDFSELESTSILTIPGTGLIGYDPTWRAIKGKPTLLKPDQTVSPIDFKDISYIRRFPLTTGSSGPPRVVASFNRQLNFRPLPDTAGPYQVILDVWVKPTQAQNIQDTVLNLPDDWLEILDWAAAMRGHTELFERDKARELQMLLYGGYNADTKQKVTGIITQKMQQRQAEAPARDYGMQPRLQQYTSAQ